MPDLYIITGANGAGKSTVGYSYLPEVVQKNYPVFDGDKLATNKRNEIYKLENPSLKEANRIAIEWLFGHFEKIVKEALLENKDFVYEGHLPADENWKTPQRFKKAGYKIHLIFFSLRDTELSELRVMDRAKDGGHNVPPYEIERNYYGNLYQLNKRFKKIDELKIVDTSASNSHTVLATLKSGEIDFALHHGKLPEWFEKFLPKLYKIISDRDYKE